jgi:hypothetical protein
MQKIIKLCSVCWIKQISDRGHSKYVHLRVRVSVYVVLSWMDEMRDRQSVSFLRCY